MRCASSRGRGAIWQARQRKDTNLRSRKDFSVCWASKEVTLLGLGRPGRLRSRYRDYVYAADRERKRIRPGKYYLHRLSRLDAVYMRGRAGKRVAGGIEDHGHKGHVGTRLRVGISGS